MAEEIISRETIEHDGFVYRVGGPGQIDSLWAATAGGQPSVLVHRLASSAVSMTPVSPDGQRIAFVDPAGIHVVSMSGGRPGRSPAGTSSG